jgi:hypothetical protein
LTAGAKQKRLWKSRKAKSRFPTFPQPRLLRDTLSYGIRIQGARPEFYIGKFPYRKTQIAKHRHLQFHVESFLHELYILQERLVQFLKFIERQHRRDPRLPQIKAACAVLNTLVIDSMKKGIAIRGSHVHRWRMSDTKIDRLNAISFYTMMPNKKIKRVFKEFYESEYGKTRKQWRGWITGGIAEAQKLVDAYFDEVFKLVFYDNGKLAYPGRLKF